MTEPEEPPRGPAAWLAMPGRLLRVFTLLGGMGLLCFYLVVIVPELPAGRYPIWFFAAPIVVGAFLFFLGAAYVLEKLGVTIYLRDRP